ncbi:MAG: hypothetical protein KBG28_12400 [Kofleriaceae bacterium]|jgi:hypothetical protein|nr:hypothetical protein [Kofleriaceae bacterium]MBP6838981.1 hypothetical protein [Kofleriaceae bacterium]MBP9204761.1 hypothetical protein [Kofleriaceae bacterium]
MLEGTLHQLACDACLELFAAYDTPITPISPLETNAAFYLCGIIGFTSERLAGALVLAASQATIERSNPLGPGSPRPWIAELTNQLGGRFKRRLLGRGIEVWLSTPIVMRGNHLAPVPRLPSVAPEPSCAVAGADAVCVWVEADWAPGLTLDGEPLPIVGAESEVMLF